MSSKGWNVLKIGNIGRIVTGKTPPTQYAENFGNKYPFITPRDMSGQKRINQTERYLSEKGKNEVKNCLLPVNAICVSCIGSDMGKVVMTTTNSITNQQLNSIICNDSFNPDFIYYALVNISSGLRNIGHNSTAVPILNKTDFSNFEISVPDIFTQRRIAEILSALDDKIELNRQTNATLEAIAQAIFKEWFVDFDFPGATGEMVESEMGMIPKGWRVGSVGDILVLANETTSPGVDPDKLFNHYSIPAFDSGRVPSQELGSTILSNKYKVKCNSILVSKLNPRIPRIWALKEVDQESSVCSTEFQVLLPQKAHYYSFAANLFSQQSMIDTMKSRASGTSSSHQRINPLDILDINIVVPTNDLIALYDKIVGNYFHCIINGLEESINLAKIRDSLLPKLMNGEIDV